MRVSITTGSETIALAGEDGVSDRTHSGAVDLEIEAATELDVIRRVRSDYALPIDRGNIATRVRFQSRRMFDTAAEAESFAADHTDLPREGIVYFDTGAGRRKLLDARIDPPVCIPDGCAVTAIYQAAGGAIVLVEPDIIISDGSQLPNLLFRVVNDGAEKWAEWGVVCPAGVTGTAADGWTGTPAGHLILRIERSENLVDWDHDLTDSPTSPEIDGDEFTYWARSIYPVDSAIKTGLLWAESTPSTGDSRNNPFTSLVVNNVSRAIGGFPYTMPGDAARMQADMIANGLTGATVVASSATVWRIDVPNVYQTAYAAVSRVGWAGYLVADLFGNLTVTINGRDLTGQFVNSSGVRTAVPKQFARAGLSAGPNYQY